MSSLNIFGFFALANGHRVRTVRPGSTSAVYHTLYDSALQCAQGPALPADIRIYSPMGDALLQDNTVVFLLGKLWTPSTDTIHIDTVLCIPFPGDPSSDSYEDTLPDAQYPFIVGLGNVSATVPLSADDTPVPIPVRMTEWVRDELRSSSIVYVYVLFKYVSCPQPFHYIQIPVG